MGDRRNKQPPYRRLHPLYFGGSEGAAGDLSPESIQIIQQQLTLEFTDIGGVIDEAQLPSGFSGGCCEPVAVAGELVFTVAGDVVTTHTE